MATPEEYKNPKNSNEMPKPANAVITGRTTG